MRVIGATTGSRPETVQRKRIGALIDESLAFLDCHATITEDDLVIYDQYAGDGYGYVTEGKLEAIKLVAETEGILLDPVYTGSAMACLIDLCRTGFFAKDDTVVFLHTGGAAALFPYKGPLKNYCAERDLPWEIPAWSP
jgi:1-aminocyclopropane-1-carboxylate deaminase/D-cysteine desulfhydrase-like pyridoxal-dependent ACC family enzyme